MNSFRESLARRRAELREEGAQKGFTLIELMIVIIIIGLLAAIAIPVFLNQRVAAWDAETKSDMAEYIIAASSYSLDYGGNYGTSATPMTTAALIGAPYNFVPSADDPVGNWTLTVSANRKSYTVSAYNKNFVITTGHVITFDSASGSTSTS